MQFDQSAILPSPSAARIAEVERDFSVRFPSDYVDMLHTANGAKPAKPVIPIEPHRPVIETFFAVLDEPECDTVNGWRDVTVVASQVDTRLTDSRDRLGLDVIPIAALFGGDLLCLDLRIEGSQSISIWNHEASDDFKADLTPIASSITDLLSRLEPLDA